jgi:hypothetical protein
MVATNVFVSVDERTKILADDAFREGNGFALLHLIGITHRAVLARATDQQKNLASEVLMSEYDLANDLRTSSLWYTEAFSFLEESSSLYRE